MSSCLGRASVPVKRVWRGLTSSLGRHHRRRRTTTTGNNNKLSNTSPYVPVMSPEDHEDGGLGVLGRLRREVRTCEYRDVHVMWEMLGGDSAGVVVRGVGSTGEEEDVDVATGNKGRAAPKKKTRGRRTAAWSGFLAYCCAF